ncbi:MAG: glycosyl hydrolase family 43 [Myxococcota bacterium]
MDKIVSTVTAFLSALILVSCGGSGGSDTCWYTNDSSVDLAALLCGWKEYPGNPMIEPAGDGLIGDPTIVLPADAPDGRWHMFANGLMGIHHLTSADGLSWNMLSATLFSIGVVRPYVFREKTATGSVYYMFVEKFDGMTASETDYSTSTDLKKWADLKTLLKPELAWETDPHATLGNPFLMYRADQKKYWLYYSASNVFIPECNFYEPLQIGVATSENILGPYTKNPSPIISPDSANPLRNMGAGSIKLLGEKVGGRFIALSNGIYSDSEGKSRSAIEVLSSTDGLKWDYVCNGVVVAPSGDGWKKAFVYAFDTVRVGDQIRMYFNARDDWAGGIERIGMATLDLKCSK